MSCRFSARVLFFVGVLAILGPAGCLHLAKDSETGTPVGNLPPSVRITGGAASPDPHGVDYRAQFQWSGSDVDGVVSLYRYAIDDTTGEFAWHDTTGFSASFRFSANDPQPGQPATLGSWHTFFLRAIDNDLAWSSTERRSFNATTIAPTTRITHPVPAFLHEQNSFPPAFLVSWEGEDLDSSRPDRRPVAYEYKLIEVPEYAPDSTVLGRLVTQENLLLDAQTMGDRARWIRVRGSQLSLDLRDLPATGPDMRGLAFAVRAVDEAGAVEPVLVRNRNFFCFTVTSMPFAPYVTVTEPTLGSHMFPREGNLWEVEVLPWHPYTFRWTGDASYYGSTPGMSWYGLDCGDPGDVPGGGAWREDCGSGWGLWTGARYPVLFTPDQAGSYHLLTILVRDASNSPESTRHCLVRLHVVSFRFSRFALVVDDAVLPDVSDQVHDRFLATTLLTQLDHYGQVDQWAVYGDDDPSASARALPNEMLTTYQNIIWNLDYGSQPSSGIHQTEMAGNRGLSEFLAAGGRLFICGGPVVRAMERQHDFYPRIPPPLTGGSASDAAEREKLWYNLLYIRSTLLGATDRSNACNAQSGGLVAAFSGNPNFPDLRLDPRKWSPEEIVAGHYRGGITDFEAWKARPGEPPVRLSGLDTLYTARTFNRNYYPCADVPGSADGGVCGWRYESTRADTLANRQHGRVIVFDFQPYYFESARLTDAGTAAVNWLLTGRDR